ncbi:aminoglycoside phosphotransferase family protein [Luteolibacter pohnpeiensis]|uniref:Aminoglycoside phosphotransferase family protein n=1 Tax=Luteolibacter pohnpeiensis TaxID=454153 RepID=A0A934VX87_9BACT|nr:aminoglycoside phosphotransferase family protein [Luteolibacter pohnpeiensis]MBK1883279.1 aminoglycoside phosphotransferase family protein [Luteolibacter pohnpeiensis]
MMPTPDPAIHAATEIAISHGIVPDRSDVLQNGNTVVVRLTETLVARIVADVDGPRQGTSWFERENAIAQHLAVLGAPVIPMHPELPPGPYHHSGYPVNFWKFVTQIELEPTPGEIGSTLHHCHRLLESFQQPLPKLAILHESLELLETLEQRGQFTTNTADLLRESLAKSLDKIESSTMQPLHGDAHPGNVLNTTEGLLWTDWEDAFLGPIEWDLASIIWNARILDNDQETADGILTSYEKSGGTIDPMVLQHCLIARAAVMSIWYPVLYPDLTPERKAKLQRRLDWLHQNRSSP